MEQSIAAHAVFDLLRAGAEHCASVTTVEQAAAMQGVSRAELKGIEAMWAGAMKTSWQRKEKQRRMGEYERTSGRKPPRIQDVLMWLSLDVGWGQRTKQQVVF